MANWSDPQPNATAFSPTDARTAAYDVGLRRYMLSVYNYMTSAVLLSGLVAMFFAWGGENSPAAHVLMGGGILRYVIMFAPLGFILAMNMGLSRMSDATLQALFWGFAVVMGLSLSSIFLVYSGNSIAQAFFASAASFAGLSLYGYTTKRDLGPIGTFLIMGVIGLFVAMLLNLWLHSSAFALAINLVGVLIFAGLTAYDTQRTKSMYAYVAGTDAEPRAAIMSATTLYLDFINMFLFLLRMFGSSRN
jgi:hypothetical protein